MTNEPLTPQSPMPGDIVSGTLAKFLSKGLLFRLDEGSFGLVRYLRVPYLSRFNQHKVLNVGDRFSVTVLKTTVGDGGRGHLDLDGRTLRPDPWERVEAAHPIGQKLLGTVAEGHPEGAFVEFDSGFRALVPNSEVSWKRGRVRAADCFDPGDRIEVVICSFQQKRKQIIASLRRVQPNPWESISSVHFVGQRLEGRIDEFLQFGAVIAFSTGFTALVHNTEVSWTDRSAKAADTFAIGDRIEVEIQGIDAEKGTIYASYRMTQPNPWKDAVFAYPPGSQAVGVVVHTRPFGLLVRLDNGCVGVLHKSNIPERFQQAYEEGDRIEVIVWDHDPPSQRIFLALDISSIEEELSRVKAVGEPAADAREEAFIEGTRRAATLNYYERNPRAREKCIWHYGTRCLICNQALKDIYGEVAENLIHIHHLKQLADVGTSHELDPIAGLRPVCPNCHAVVHLRRPPYSIEEAKAFLAQARSGRTKGSGKGNKKDDKNA